MEWLAGLDGQTIFIILVCCVIALLVGKSLLPPGAMALIEERVFFCMGWPIYSGHDRAVQRSCRRRPCYFFRSAARCNKCFDLGGLECAVGFCCRDWPQTQLCGAAARHQPSALSRALIASLSALTLLLRLEWLEDHFCGGSGVSLSRNARLRPIFGKPLLASSEMP